MSEPTVDAETSEPITAERLLNEPGLIPQLMEPVLYERLGLEPPSAREP